MFSPLALRHRALAAVCLAPCVTLSAQTALPNSPQPRPAPDQQSQSERELKQETQQRMLGVVPAVTAVYSGHAAALSSHQKFRLWAADAFDPFDFAEAAADAALEQNSNEFPEYGPGFPGYAKRFGSSFADDLDGTLWGEAILPSLLHQDPRYFRLGQGSFGHRVGYSLLSAVRCKGDNGHWQANVSNIGGNLIGGAISNAYYPAADRGAGLTFQRGFTVTAEGLLSAIANEFYPDVAAAFFHHKTAQQQGK